MCCFFLTLSLNFREFIERRLSRSSDSQSPSRLSATSPYRAGSSPYRAGSSPYRAGSSPFRAGSSPCKSVDLDDMDAWEISMRIDMADIQKKYRYSPFHKTLPRYSLQMHWISVRFYERKAQIIVFVKKFINIISTMFEM